MNLPIGIILFFIWFSQFTVVFTDNQIDESRKIEMRITGGEKAEPFSHPYMVSLQGYYKWDRYRICGGSIVSRRWIVTAGHCVTDYWPKWLPMNAIVGAYNLKNTYKNQTYYITDRIPHPYYKGGVGPYDIAMLRTDREIQYSDRVQPIMLPQMPQQFMRYESLTITGWGALEANYFVTVLPNKLREAEVSYLPFYECYKAVSRFKDYYKKNPLVKEFNLCTGPLDGSVAGCTGDSGGPLIRYMINPGEMTTESTTMESTTTESTTVESSTTDSTTMESTTDSTTMESTTDSTTMESTTDSTTMESTIDSTTTESTTDSTTMESTTDSTTMESTTDSTTMESTTDSTTMESTTGESTTTDMTTEFNENAMIPVLVGIISWGVVPCGIKGAPTVYTNVSRHMDFINEYIYS